eukprot:gnl/TRDRNA2_/TRDRNA2_48876_c0_seq1.p1 gnl/TRDRNA2_/TRDRNA2_48876_c0~~gnl/TRDRNA2_/TRDRNA2_48876_c0_seq1.p1  ORF type:complete len:293 (+),score=88.76 gnl/TRDRNA2_/TRDRNA2_48876_c0_seq1:77-955(+)
MVCSCSIFVLRLLTLAASCSFLNLVVTAAEPPAAKEQKAEIEALRVKVEMISVGLAAMVSPGCSLVDSKTANAVQARAEQLKSVLRETTGSSDGNAFKRLKDAQEEVQSVMKSLTAQQSNLKKRDVEQEQSLLLGTLMSYPDKPIAEQREVLRSDQFKHLAVVQAVLLQNDTKTPLIKQIVLSTLESRLHDTEDSEKDLAARHSFTMKHLDTAMKSEEIKKSKAAAKHIEDKRNSAMHMYSKAAGVSKSNIKSLKSAITAIKTGDAKMSMQMQTALHDSMKATEMLLGGFLY